LAKKALKEQGKLDKYGRPTENTPEFWLKHFEDIYTKEGGVKDAVAENELATPTVKNDVVTEEAPKKKKKSKET